MAKQKGSHSTSKTSAASSGGGGGFAYLLRNFALIMVFGMLFMVVFKANEERGALNDMYREFQQLRQSNQNPQRQQELYNDIMRIQSDTSLFTSLTAGYYWAVHDLGFGNYENIQEMQEKIETGQMKPLTRDDKLSYKVGIYPYIKYLIENTPDSAVILLPPADSLNDNKYNFIYDPEWTEYFIYPRLCLATGREADHPDLVKRITHVAIINGVGYDKLKYDVPVSQRPKDAVLPIDKPPFANPSQTDSLAKPN